MFGKSYELSLSKDYVRHWGVIEAVRELIQNALDSESPFVYELEREDDSTYTLSLVSEFATLTPQSLLLGATTKADAPSKIGSFGEGYKIALLVLTREGQPTTIFNGAVQWTPYFKYSKQYEDDLLCIEEMPTQLKSTGLRFMVSGLSEEQVGAIRGSCLQMQSAVGEVRRVSSGEILMDQPGALYVGGLFICKTELKYGYNVLPACIRLERDRKTVDGFDLKNLTRDMWFETGDYAAVATMMEAGVPDVEYARYYSPELVKEACYRLFRSKHPGAIVAGSNVELQQMVEQGMTNVVYVGEGYGHAVRNSAAYRSEAQLPKPPTPQQHLVAWWGKAKHQTRAAHHASFEALIKDSSNWTINQRSSL